MKILCIIPSRIGSTRLPRKPLLLINGKPMIQIVYEAAKACKFFDRVIVATDNEEIAKVIKNCNGEVEFTDSVIKTGSDRVAVVAKKYNDVEVVVNLQGDEPFVQPSMLETLIAPYLNGEQPDMTTLVSPLDISKDLNNPEIVKVISDLKGRALYFSRSPIPYFRNKSQHDLPLYHHLGIYAFRYNFLMDFIQLKQTPLELTESLEQLRALEHGYHIQLCLTPIRTLEINTPEDLTMAQTWRS